MGRPSTTQIAIASILGGLALASEVIPGPPFDIAFPLYPKISWDLTGVPIMVSLFLYGPLAGTYTGLVGCSMIFLRGNVAGGTMKLIAELATVWGYAVFRRRTALGSASAVLARVATMTVANYLLLPFFYRMPVAVVVALLPAIAAFNVTQALINIIPSYIVCKRIRRTSFSQLSPRMVLKSP